MTETATISQHLAAFAAHLDVSSMPESVVESAALRLLDTIGVAIAARHERGPTLVRTMVEEHGRGARRTA